MSSPLAHVPIASRRKLASTVGLFALGFGALALLAGLAGHSTGTRVLGGVAAAVTVLLGLIAWGLVRSVSIDLAERELDATLTAAVAAHGMSCGCGHEHDPAELHITDECEHDGAGEACAHDCDNCALAGLRRTTTSADH